MLKSNVMERLKSFFLRCVDGLLFIDGVLILTIVLSGGFLWSPGGTVITMSKTRNPTLIFGILLLLRKILDRKRSLYDIPVISFVSAGLRKLHTLLGLPPAILAGVFAGGYAVVMSAITVLKHLSYNSHAFDLGIFDQVLWNTAHGDILYSSLLGGRHFFGEHFSPILLVLSPLYWIDAHPELLLVVQSCALASGAIPVYWLAKKKLDSPLLALLFVWLYVCYRPLRNVNLFDFHPIALATPFLLFAFWYLDQRKYGTFGVFLLLALGCKEEIAMIVFIFGIYLALVQKKRLAGSLLSLTGMVLLFLDIWVIIPHYRQGSFAFVSRYSYLGGSIPEILKTLAFRPLYVAKHVFIAKKMQYVSEVFGPVGFLSFLSPSHLLLAVPTFFQNILSESKPQYTIGYQYTAPLTPFVFISAICGLHNLLHRPNLRRRLHFLVGRSHFTRSAALLLLFCSLFYLGRSPIHDVRKYRITSYARLTDTTIRDIPASASVSTQETLVPHLAHRKHIHEFPIIDEAEYVLLDITASTVPISRQEYMQKVEEVLQEEVYGVMLMKESILLLKRAYSRADNAHALSKIQAGKTEGL